MNKVYYSQIDKRWSNYPYPSPSLPYATIGSGGCGVACAAMVVSMLKQIILPTEIADMFLKDGIRVNGGTSNTAFDSYLTNKYGLKVTRNWKLDDAIACLKRGGVVVARCLASKGKLFTTGGHFIILVGYKNDIIEVFDSYLYTNKFNTPYRNGKASISGTSVFVTYSNMKEYGGYNELWCYEPTGVDTNKDETIVIEAPKTVTKQVKVKTSLNVRSGAGTNHNVVGSLYNGNTVNVYETTNGWSRIGENKWVSDKYLITVNPTTQNVKVMTVIAKSGLNVRVKPDIKSNRITTYKYGTKVNVYSIENGWAKGTKGYMSAQYLK